MSIFLSKKIFYIVAFIFLLLGYLILTRENNNEEATSNKTNVEAVFYDSYGYLKGDNWYIPIKIWISKDLNTARKLTLKGIRKLIQKQVGLEKITTKQKAYFLLKSEDFLRDSLSQQTISLTFEKDPLQINYLLKTSPNQLLSDRNGLIETTLVLTVKQADKLLKLQHSSTGELILKLSNNDIKETGKIRLIGPTGLSVISDIDDTIKITNILRGNEKVLINTFFKQFKAVDGMPERYNSYDNQTSFHYVSGAPWQLYRPIKHFLNQSNFPLGSLHMKNVRTNFTEIETYEDVAKLINGGATQVQKLQQIEQLLFHFPHRKFILIGDSGEHDPEIYRILLESYPDRILKIYIRDVKNDHKCQPDRLQGMEIIPVADQTILIACSSQSI